MADVNEFEWEHIDSQNDIIENLRSHESQRLCEAFNKFLIDGNHQMLISFLKKKAVQGRDIPIINNAIAQLLKSRFFNYDNYWSFVRILVMHNASLFMTTICNNTTSSVFIPECNSEDLDDIVNYAFKATDKLRQAISIVSVVSSQLTYEQKSYILTSCLQSSNPETLKYAFDTLNLPPQFVISFLRNKLDNDVALFTLYEYYRRAHKNHEISNDTVVEVFSIPYINILLFELKKKGNKCKDVAELIEYELNLIDICKNKKLYKLVTERGHGGFANYYGKILSKARVKERIENLILDTKEYSFKLIGSLPNYYVLQHCGTGLRSLLPKDLCSCPGQVHGLLHAYIYCFDKKNKVLFINQSPLPHNYKNPFILEYGSVVDVSFSKRKGRLCPHIRNHTSLIQIKVRNIYRIRDYKRKYKAVVQKRISDFCYLVDVIIDN